MSIKDILSFSMILLGIGFVVLLSYQLHELSTIKINDTTKHIVKPEYYLDLRTQSCYAYFPGSWTTVTCTKEVLDLIK